MDYCTLCGVSLSWVPEELSYGYASRIIRHDYIGGGRGFDVMGDDPPPINLSGRLTGLNMLAERDALAALRGIATTLVVGSDTFPVLVRSVDLTPVWGLITYKIVLEVQTSAPSSTTASSGSQTAASATSQANALATPSAISAPVGQASSILANSVADPSTALPYLTSAGMAANTAVTGSTATIGSSTGLDTVSGQSVAQFTAGWASLVAAYQTRSTASQAGALISGAINALQG